jgi:hypothetical protein
MKTGDVVKRAVLASLAFCLLASMLFAADDTFRFKFDYDSRSVVDSTRRDWYEYVYSPASAVPAYEKRQYDKNFISSQNDLALQISGDLSETHFLDVKEQLYYRHYNNQELLSRDYSSFKYKELDHLLNITWGIAAGDHDYFQFDYHNNIVDIPEADSLSYRFNRGSAQMSHEFCGRTVFSLLGSYEERQFETDVDRDFREATAGFEILSLVPGHHRYVPVANSARGEKKYFAEFPGAMAARKAIDYYTDYAVNPRDDDPRARYMREKTRGDLFVRVFADLATRDIVTVGNRFNRTGGGFELAYEIAADMTLRLRDSYSKVDYRKESGAYFHHDHTSNYLALAADYDYSPNMSQTITFSDELQNHPAAEQENFRINTLVYEGFYGFGRSRASVTLAGLRRRYQQRRQFYPDENEYRAGVGYDYLVTDTIRFRMKSEFVNCEYEEFEDYLFSSHNRNTFRIGVEKAFSRSNSLELAFQQNSEKHERFYQNNLEEKSLNLSWLSHF